MEIGTIPMSKHKNYNSLIREKHPEIGDMIQIKTSLGGWSEPMLVISRSKGHIYEAIIELLDQSGEILAISPSSSIYNIHIMSKKDSKM